MTPPARELVVLRAEIEMGGAELAGVGLTEIRIFDSGQKILG